MTHRLIQNLKQMELIQVAVCETYNYNVTVTIVISGDTITSVTAESEAGAQDVQYFNMANAKVMHSFLQIRVHQALTVFLGLLNRAMPSRRHFTMLINRLRSRADL